MTLAKSLANGVPIGALVATEEVARAFTPGSHASTFGGNPLATRAGCAVVDTLLNDGILPHCAEMGTYFMHGLADLMARHACITEVRGKGLLIGLELNMPGKDIVDRCMEKGFLINCTMETVLRFAPPLIVTRSDIDALLTALEEVFSDR
jgi:acetylornithine/succinyldiaminopimelate/putrescine aminotransferase